VAHLFSILLVDKYSLKIAELLSNCTFVE